MKMKITVKTEAGFYDEAEIQGSTLMSLLKRVIPVLTDMPPVIDGVSQHNWTQILISVES